MCLLLFSSILFCSLSSSPLPHWGKDVVVVMETAKHITLPTFLSFLLLQVASMELQPCRKSNLITLTQHTQLPHAVADSRAHTHPTKRNESKQGPMHAHTCTQKCKTAGTKAYTRTHTHSIHRDTHIISKVLRAEQRGLWVVCSLRHTHCSLLPSLFDIWLLHY